MSRSKNWLIFLVIMLAGLVAGGFIGDYASKIRFMSWLAYGAEFGITDPFQLNLGVLILTFGFQIKFTLAGILGIALAIFIFRRLD